MRPFWTISGPSSGASATVGLFNSLAQTLLKITAPGVPDTYQGTELWDFSLVDPDNRRPVDYARRQRMLRELQATPWRPGTTAAPWPRSSSPARKTGALSCTSPRWPSTAAARIPGCLPPGTISRPRHRGRQRAHVFGFSRRQGDRAAIVAVPRLIARLLADGHEAPLGEAVWQDTRLLVPGIDPQQTWRHVFTGEPVALVVEDGQPTLAVAELMAHFPVALLMAQV